jgi:hypothetical protein
LNAGHLRFSVGAVNVRSGNFVYFDPNTHVIRPEHVMASGALPPGFPLVEIEGEHYWDSGLVSNTPLQWVVENEVRRDTLAFQADLWNACGEFPRTMFDVMTRDKEIRYSSRARAGKDDFKRTQKLRRAAAATGSASGRFEEHSGGQAAGHRGGPQGLQHRASDLPRQKLRRKFEGPSTRFDGTWNLVFLTQRGDCDPTYNFMVDVVNGNITHPNILTSRGRVAPSGAVVASVRVGQKYASGSGRLSGVSGRGVLSGRSGETRCAGT